MAHGPYQLKTIAMGSGRQDKQVSWAVDRLSQVSVSQVSASQDRFPPSRRRRRIEASRAVHTLWATLLAAALRKEDSMDSHSPLFPSLASPVLSKQESSNSSSIHPGQVQRQRSSPLFLL